MNIYSLKINQLFQSSQAGVYFIFNSTPAKNTSVWVKKSFCVSSSLSCRCTIDTWGFVSFMIFWPLVTPLDRLSIYFPLFQLKKCLHIWMVSILSLGEQVRFSCIPGRCGHWYQTRKYDCMFNELKQTSLATLLTSIFFFLVRLEFIQFTQVWVQYFESFIQVKPLQGEKGHFSREMS